MVMLLSLLSLLIVASGFDLHQRRIPNAIPLCILLLAIALLLLAPGAALAPGWGAGLAGLGLGAVLMLAMGYTVLSMNATSLPRVKQALRKLTHAEACEVLAEVIPATP